MTEAQKILLSLLSRAMSGESTLTFPEDDTARRAVIEESIRQSVCLIACDALYDSERGFDAPYRTLKKYADATLKNNLLGYENHRAVCELLKTDNIPCVIIKGIASDRYYPKKYLRSIGDVDIFVRHEDLEHAGELLVSNGFVPLANSSEHHCAYIKDNLRTELHYTVGDPPEGIADTVNSIYFSENGIIETAEYVDYGGASLPVCNSFFHGLTLLLHTAGHIASEGIGLRHLCDWAAFINNYGSEGFMREFEPTLTKLGLMTLAGVLTKAAHCIGVGKYEFAESIPDETVQMLIEDIFISGNMGRKNTDGTFSKLNRHDTDKSCSESKLAYLIKTLNNHVYIHLPSAKKHPILLVPGYVYVIFRRLSLRLAGKRRRVDIDKSYDSAKRRDKLIGELELYK